MNNASWIAIFIAVLFAIRAGRKSRGACGSPGSLFTILLIVAAFWFFFAFSFSIGRRTVTSISPAIRIPTLPALPRIVAPRITPPRLRITTRPMVFRDSTTQPTAVADNMWLQDWPAFVDATHWQGFRAESSNTCVTQAEAHQQAIENAATTLSQLAVADPSIAADASSRPAMSLQLKNAIAAQLQSGQFISDQFVQKTEKSYGTLYKAYLLIQTPDSTIAALNQFARDTSAQSKTNEIWTWASTGGLFLVIVLLYAFLNAATKGYFVWKLRAAAMMVLIIAVLALFAWGS
jgi:hypothetical protein